VIALAKHNPGHLYFSGRNAKSANTLIDEIKTKVPNVNITFLECDLASLTSVQNAAKQFLSQSQRLDILMCNAGIMALPPGLTKDGYEIQFGTNHVGHALLIKLLLPTLLKTADEPGADVRIVCLTSRGYGLHPSGGIHFKDLHTSQENIGLFAPWRRYGQSKLANLLYAAELARRYPKITSVSIHPGVYSTGLVGTLGFWKRTLIYLTNLGNVKDAADGTGNQLWAATGDKSGIVNGAYYVPIGVLGPLDGDAKSEKLAAELWEWTENEMKGYQS
jgi:NAD(P)-dependent dehydrogenase (short-subunit alcohol dehydrogenase family)